MPHSASAKKRHRQNLRDRERNRQAKSVIKTSVRKVLEAVSAGDAGLARLANAKTVEVLDLWSLPRVTDASVDVIAALPGLEELSIRETGITAAGLAKLAVLPGLQSLTFKNNGPIPTDLRAKLAARKWKKLDLGEAK